MLTNFSNDSGQTKSVPESAAQNFLLISILDDNNALLKSKSVMIIDLDIPEFNLSLFSSILESAKCPQIRLYGLRHTIRYAFAGSDCPQVVAERFGHSTIVFTSYTYIRFSDDAMDGNW